MDDLKKMSKEDIVYAHGAAAFRAGTYLKSKTDWQEREKACAKELLRRLSRLEALEKKMESAPHEYEVCKAWVYA